FLRVADALNAVRVLIGRERGWPSRLTIALPLAVRGFDRVASNWEWTRLAQPEPERSGFRRQKEAEFWEKHRRPDLEAALSWRAAVPPEECPDDVLRLAEEGEAAGCAATMTLDGYDLRLMSSLDAVGGIPTAGKSLIVVAAVKDVLHFRIL